MMSSSGCFVGSLLRAVTVFPVRSQRSADLMVAAGARRGAWKLHRDAEPAGGAGGEGEGPVVCLGDALDDRQAEADARVVGAYALGAALKRLGKRGNQLRGELLAGVLDGEHRALRGERWS